MAKIFRNNEIKLLVILLDCMLSILSYSLISQLFSLVQVQQLPNPTILNNAPWIFGMLITTYWLFDLYNFTGRREYTKSMYNLILAHAVIAVELLIIDRYYPLTTLSASTVLVALGLQLVFVFGSRSFLFWIQFKAIGKKNAVIIANDAVTAKAILNTVTLRGKAWFEVKGIILAANWNRDKIESLTLNIDLVILSHDTMTTIKSEVIQLVGSKRIEVLVVPELYELFLMGAEVQFIDDLLVYSMVPPQLSYMERMTKRAMDVVLSLILLVITSPITLLFMFLIPRTSRGKAVFRQERIGLNGKPFMVLKFRTMIDNAEVATGPILAADHDARITKLGKFIRSTRIDELPQLVNVIKGEMSLVGPRPEREFFINEFVKQIPHYTYRMMVKPGLTGLAQVKAKYSTSSSDKLRYDLTYIKNYSPILDVMVLFQTIIVVLQREQSKGVHTAGQVTENLHFLARQETAASATKAGGTAAPSFPLLAGETSAK